MSKTWDVWELREDIREGMGKGFDLKVVTEGYCFMINHRDFEDLGGYDVDYLLFKHKRDKPNTIVKVSAIVGFEWVASREPTA